MVEILLFRCVCVGGGLIYRASIFFGGGDFWRSEQYFVLIKMCLIIFNFFFFKSKIEKNNTYNFTT